MKKIAIIGIAALGSLSVNVAPAYANSNCMLQYMEDLSACGTDSNCAAVAGLTFLLCEEAANRPPVPE